MVASPSPAGSLRAENRRRATERIVDATANIVRERGDVSFSMREVAEQSGVSLRTLYRYFPGREDLVNALAGVADQVDVGPVPATLADLESWIVTAWTNLMEEEALLRAQHQGPGGVEIRKKRTKRHREMTAALISSIRPDLEPARLDDLVDTTLMVSSSTAMFEFIDVIGVDVERAGRLVAEAIVALLERE